MRIVLPLALLFSLTLPFGLKVFFIGDYCVNYIEYAKELCENKDNSELHCNGKCQLNKNLNKFDSSDKEAPNSSNSHHVEVSSFIVPEFENHIHSDLFSTLAHHYFTYSELKNTTFKATTTPPPEQFV